MYTPSSPQPRMSTYLVAFDRPGPYAHWTDTYSDEHGDIPLGLYCRLVAGRVHGPRATLQPKTKQGISAFYHNNFGRSLRVRQVRTNCSSPNSTPVQWKTRGAVGRSWRTTSSASKVHQGLLTSDAAETVLHEMGAHVVRRPRQRCSVWDDLWLNEFVRDVRPPLLCQGRGPTEYTQAGTTFRQTPRKSWGLPAGPAAVDASGGRRHPRPCRRRGELRRHHVRQGRPACSSSSSAYVGLEEFLFRSPGFTSANHAFGKRPRSATLLGALEKASGRDLFRLGAAVAQDPPGSNTLRPDFDLDADGRFTRFAIVPERWRKPGAG